MKFHATRNIHVLFAVTLAFWLQTFSLQAGPIQAELTKVANLPLWNGDAIYTPQSPRGGILQLGDELWFMTYSGGLHSVGAIASYDMVTQDFTTQYSFGLPDPMNPWTARHDGNNPWKSTLIEAQDGTLYYTTTWGGVSNTGLTNGGAIGIFDPVSGTASVVWSGGTAGNEPRTLYNEPVYLRQGTQDVFYFSTFAGGSAGSGSAGWGTVQKVVVENGVLISSVEVSDLWADSGARQPQGGLVLVGDKIYFTTASAAGGAVPTLQMVDTATDMVTVLSDTFTTGGNNGGWNTPIYDPAREAIYSVALSGGILKWDINTSLQSILPNSADGGAGNFSDPILFGDSIYYVKQGTNVATNGGSIWRYDLQEEELIKLFDLQDYGAAAASQSGSLSLVWENGQEVLYFLTAASDGSNFGALFRLEIQALPIPEPSAAWLLMAAGTAWVLRRGRNRSSNRG